MTKYFSLFAIFAGVAVGFLFKNIAAPIFLLFFTFCLFVFTIALISLIIGLVRKKQSAVRFSVYLLTFITISFISAMCMRIVEQDKKRKVADEIVVYLDNYKTENNELPANLLGMNKGLEDYRYTRDFLNRYYMLQYSIDGWHYARYTSRTGEWVEGD